MEKNSLDFKITMKNLWVYAFPTLLSNFFMNIYGIVDSLFISNYVGTDGLSALNITWPLMSIGFAAGGHDCQWGQRVVCENAGREERL